MTDNQTEYLSGLISDASTIADQAWAEFGQLTAQQLNWKPAADQWSIAQCLDHLVTANEAYFPIFDSVLSGKKKNTFWESLPVLPKFWGKMLIKAISPETKRKMTAPKVFQPSSSNVDADIVNRFIDQQNRIVNYMKATADLDLEKIKITSPVTNVITYSLMDAYTVVIRHEQRHLLQAKRVQAMDGFSK